MDQPWPLPTSCMVIISGPDVFGGDGECCVELRDWLYLVRD